VRSSTALLTDRYELTMLDAALRAGTAGESATFEVFTRGLPAGRQVGVFAGLGRLLDAIETFRFGPEELAWLGEAGVVTPAALEWLAAFEFAGDVDAYAEGELYTGGSPLLTVEAPFGQAVLLETLVLSILNHDSSVAAAASLIAQAAAGRPVIEMGSRRTDTWAAVAAARAAYIGGLDSTSNLAAGRRYGVPTAGTVAHAFVLSFADEEAAFAAQVKAFGPDTTLLVDTYDMEDGIRRAVEAAGPELTAIRVDSGDLGVMARRARELLDELGATRTRVVVTGDLDDRAIRALGAAPVDGYGVGTSVVTGLGVPTAGLIYKLVAVGGRPVAKRSPGKATFGGRKWAWRVADRAEEVVATSPEAGPDDGRPLQSRVMTAGARVEGPGTVSLDAARVWHRRVRDELPAGEALQLARAR
jgi:nicotinate phosphoribosyltransferase